MSSEYDPSYEAFLLGVFEIEKASSESNSDDIQIPLHSHHNNLIDNNHLTDDEALQQTSFDYSEPVPLHPPELAPSSSQITTSTMNAQMLQDTEFDVDELE